MSVRRDSATRPGSDGMTLWKAYGPIRGPPLAVRGVMWYCTLGVFRMKKMHFNIDVLGGCNLRCPSCPQGNVKGYRLPSGQMDPKLLTDVVSKARSECEVMGIELFNWTEPLLHSKLPELIRIVNAGQISCHLSSNLNVLREADEVLAANPYSFRISCSGFTQEVYGYTHRGGDIKRVKKNMILLAEAKRRQKATTRLHVLYHRYKHNLRDEPPLRAFANSLGIEFQPVWAFMMPLEKVLAFIEENPGEAGWTEEDSQLVSKLALGLREAFQTAEKYKDQRCFLQDSKIAMDFQANVQLCCAVYDASKFTIANFLTTPLEEIQRRKYAHEMCARCAKHGAQVYVNCGVHEFEEVAVRNVPPEDARLLDLKFELMNTKFRRGLERVYRDYFSSFLSLAQSAWLGTQYDRLQRGLRVAKRAISRK